ncbi:hypothetical protein EXIGLDRAFT_211281 [Exidia glandulosa HHB12029]|uniref:Uncharacterized protein n=1 Tax=Exidia glandulosa HHB12029 TaxID=1314781 RepID=A0A165EJV3_EXIGL|nr:hypothetical protein EXIGLDRAFT_211281 [Exidia glandulosa HHB12029]
MAPTVPAELTDIIIDALEHDLETLEICSQVARSWRPRSLVHLFSAIEVRADEIPGDAAWTRTRQHLHSAIQMTGSRFSHFVSRRSGRAMFPLIRQLVFMAYAANWAPFARIWNNLDIPARLVRVQYLRISIWGYASGNFDVPLGRDSFETTIVGLVRLCSPYLESLSISAYRSGFNPLYIPHVIMPTVECCPLVHHLHIDSVGQGFRHQPSDPVPDWSNLARHGPTLFKALHLWMAPIEPPNQTGLVLPSWSFRSLQLSHVWP